MEQVGERGPGRKIVVFTTCVYISASFQASCSAWDMGMIIPISQMEILLERLGHILNSIPAHLGLSSPVSLFITYEGTAHLWVLLALPAFSRSLRSWSLPSAHCPS